MAWAIAASVVVHGAVLIAMLPQSPPGMPEAGPLQLRATLTSAPIAEETPPLLAPDVVAAVPVRSPDSIALPASPPRIAPPAPASAPHVGSEKVFVRPIAGGMRIGDYSAVQANRFPGEVDRPVRMDEEIEVRYPESALAQGREGSVTVWAIVDALGKVADVYVAEGADEFTEAVVPVVRAAHFHPAENNMKQIRYPIALQFDFRIPPGLARAQEKEREASVAKR